MVLLEQLWGMDATLKYIPLVALSKWMWKDWVSLPPEGVSQALVVLWACGVGSRGWCQSLLPGLENGKQQQNFPAGLMSFQGT